jgi:predicted unusual protein kinase regulating ubiquinone biosynthesis (AarF/ABC1/UbiB family)
LSRYAAVATLLLKHRPDLIASTDASPDDASAGNDSAEAERLTKDLEQLGPTFVKLGQVLSTRADLLRPHISRP